MTRLWKKNTTLWCLVLLCVRTVLPRGQKSDVLGVWSPKSGKEVQSPGWSSELDLAAHGIEDTARLLATH